MAPSTSRSRFVLPGWIPITLLFVAGAAVRFMHMGLIRYAYDQSYPAYQALGLLDAGVWPLIGQPSSVFLDNPALMPYIQALPLLLFRSPWAVQGLILLLNTAAIWFVWRVASDMLGRTAGWTAAFLFALNPWVVFFSRTTWVQSLVPFFMAVIAWGLWPAFVNERADSRRFFAGGVAVTLLAQTYIQAWGVLPQIGLLLLLFRRRLPKRALIAALAVFVAAATLYGIGLATRAEVNTTKAGSFLSEGWQGLSSIGLRHAVRFVNGIDFRPAYAADNSAGALWPALSTFAVVLLSLALLAGTIRAIVALRHAGRERRLATVLLVWFFLPVLMTSIRGAFDIHPHYLLLTLPAGQLLAAWGIAPLLHGQGKPSAVAALVIIGLIFAHDLYRANQLVGRTPTWPEFDGWSLAAGAEVGRSMRDALLENAEPFPRRIVADGDKALMSGLSATTVQPVRGVNYPNFILLGAEPLLYVVDGQEFPAWLSPYFDPDSVRNHAFSDGTAITMANTLPTGSLPGLDGTIARSEAGLSLIDYALEGTAAPGGELEIITTWRVDELSPERGEWYVATSYHLVDEREGQLANVGLHGQWAHRWEAGDVYVERVTIPVPETAEPGRYFVDVSLFDSIRLRPYSLFMDGSPVPSYRIPIDVQQQ